MPAGGRSTLQLPPPLEFLMLGWLMPPANLFVHESSTWLQMICLSRSIWASVTEYHRLGSLQMTEIYISQFRKLQDQGLVCTGLSSCCILAWWKGDRPLWSLFCEGTNLIHIQKTKIMTSGPITSWQIDGETMETVTGFVFLGSKITVDGDCIHEIERRLLLGRKAMTNLDSVLKSRDITLPTNVKAIVFPSSYAGPYSFLDALGQE